MSDGTESVTTDSLPTGLNLLDVPVFVFDEQGTVSDYNDVVADRFGTPDGEGAVAERVQQDNPEIEQQVRQVAEGVAADRPMHLSLPGATGESQQFSLSRLPADEQGAVVGIGHENGTRASRERALGRAYDIIADRELSLETKIDEMLGLVRETLGTDFGTLSHIDDEEYTFEAIATAPGKPLEAPDGVEIDPGETVPLSMTNCERVVDTSETLVAADIETDTPELADRAGNTAAGISCYLGTPVFVESEMYGTFCFYDTDARAAQFSEWEVTFVELLGNWVGYELERERLLEQIRAEQQERYETLVEQSNDGIVIVQNGEYVFVNDRFLELTGRDREELLGTPFEEVFAPSSRDIVTQRYENRLSDENPPSRYDIEIETKSGGTRAVEVAVSTIDHEGQPATMATLRDSTARKRREQSVRALQRATREMQTAATREEVAAVAVDAARDALDLPLSICWTTEEGTGQLQPVAATEPVHKQGYFEPLSPDQYEYKAFLEGEITDYRPSATGYDELETGVLLPLGEHGLLAAGQADPAEHDEVLLDIARTLAEHTQIALDRIGRTRALERTRARFRALTENTTYGVVTIDPTSTVQYASEGVKEVFGYSPAELEGESLLELMPERFHDPHEEAIARYLEKGTKNLDWSWIELPGRHREGHEVPLGISFGETTVDGEKRFSAVIRDITEQKQRQQELREERAFTESVFATLPDVFYAFDEFGNFIRWNDRLEEVTGYTSDEIESMHPTDFIASGDQAQVVEAIAEVFEEDTTVTVEATFETKDGEQIPYEFTGAKLADETGDTLGLVGIGRDISKRKERQRQFEAVFNNTYQFTGLMEPDGTLLEANDTALEFGDLDREDVIGKKVWNASWFAHSEELQASVQEAVDTAASGEFVREEVTVQGSDREAVIDFSVRPVTDDDGVVTLLIPEGRDITTLKEREEELRRERDHVRRTEELADVGGWEFDLSTETLYWTRGTRRLHDVDESVDPTLAEAVEFVHPDDRQMASDAIQNCREDGNSFDIEVRIVTAEGRTRWVRVEGEHVDENGAEMLRGVMGDITNRKEREQRLMVLNRVLRHNLRNKLSVVSGYAEALEVVVDTYATEGELQVERAKDHTANIKSSAKELVELGEKARQFEQAIDGADITTAVDIEEMLTELAEKYQSQRPAAEIQVTGDGQSFRGNVKFLKLAVEELLDNALTHNESPTPTVDITVDLATSEQLEITVVDDGPGIPEVERKTLTEGEESSLLHGSGVGLWTVNWLVTRLGGHVSIAETQPRGTSVTLTVPRAVDS